MSEFAENQKKTTRLECSLEFIKNKPIFSLTVIGLIGLGIRLYYFPFEIPIIYDGIDYFSYAIAVSQQGQLPNGWSLTNNGWAIFLSTFFSVFNSLNFMELIYLQRFLSCIISIFTIIPVYLLCNRFVGKQFAMIGVVLFAFEPRIIINSLLGITEPSYILLGTISLFLFLSKNFKVILISFVLLGLFSMIRYEGFLIFIPFLIIFIFRFKKDKNVIQKTFLLIGIFFLTIFPIGFFMYEATGSDSIIFPIFEGGIHYISTHIISGIPDSDDQIYGENVEENRFSLFVTLGTMNLVKFLGWVLIPTFVLFVVIGFLLLFKNRDYKMVTILIFGVTMLIPAFYVYGRGVEETRYLYILFPIFSVMSSLTIKKICEKIKKENLILTLIIVGIILSSIIFLEDKKIDFEYEKESYLVAKEIDNIAGGINHWTQWKYIPISQIANDWPTIPLPKEISYNQSFEMKRIDAKDYSTITDYLKNSTNKGLTHLVLDGKQQPDFLNYIFYNEKEFPYLIKEYDSIDNKHKNQVKIYKIDYEIFYDSLAKQ